MRQVQEDCAACSFPPMTFPSPSHTWLLFSAGPLESVKPRLPDRELAPCRLAIASACHRLGFQQ
jgi:hypothetical protein